VSPRYPVLLRLEGEPVLVVGGGTVGERKVRGLLGVGAVVTLIAPGVVPALRDAAHEGALTWLERSYDADHAASVRAGSYRFVIAATDDPAVNRQVVDDASGAGTWANDASAPDGGPASLPAVHRDGPVTVSVATGGRHPGAARWLRDLLAGAVPAEVVEVLELVDEEQAAALAQGRGVRRPDWRQVLDSGMLDLIREGRKAEAKERLEACLSSSSD
jgi:precorrin-2 dehydrogenase/sirohydrochlorin ferrochelatase